MERAYESGTANDARYFTGIEVEKSPAHGMRTLFVVGLNNPQEIAQKANDCLIKHIYLGANQSFDGINVGTWLAVIEELLDQGFWVTLDFDVRYVGSIVGSEACSSIKFIPMISVKLPYLKDLGYNACVKIDDVDFAATNPGVWCHALSELTNRAAFTPWTDYAGDQIIE